MLFPFTAVVGQHLLKDALLLNAINPIIGGVLVRGEKGTAKSTVVRALAEVLPHIQVVQGCPFQCDPSAPFGDCVHCQTLNAQGPLPVVERPMRVITLPTNASEDRVCGTLDLERALKEGQRHFEPGLLAAAHRGILYVDEVNLLDDHLVDVLLDVAAMGVNTVEREGVSMRHPARFILIGTMNPEEGELRPQLLDRFGLCVDVEALIDIDERMEVMRRRLAWERDPLAFHQHYLNAQHTLTHELSVAATLTSSLSLTEQHLRQIATVCIQLQVSSHRADLVIARTAMAIAARQQRDYVTDEDIKQAAQLALPHRMRKRPFEENKLDSQQLEQALQHTSPPPSAPPEPSPTQASSPNPPEPQTSQATSEQERTFAIGNTPDILLPTLQREQPRRTTSGKRSITHSHNSQGHYQRAKNPTAHDEVTATNLAFDATLRAAAPYQQQRQNHELALSIQPQDVRVKVRERTVGTTILFLVDASGSMGAAERMSAAKGAALQLLRDAYVQRDRVAMIAFRNRSASVLLEPTNSVEQAHAQLQKLPTGGQTPLSHGLLKATQLATQLRRRDPDALVLAVLISDGKANVPYKASPEQSPHEEAMQMATALTQSGVRLLVLDTEDDFLTLGLARELAEAAQATYLKLATIEADSIAQTVRQQL